MTIKREKKKAEDKEPFRVWIEYLKRSEKYKKLCEFFEEKKADSTLRIPDNLRDTNLKYSYTVFRNIHHPEWNFNDWWEYRKSLTAKLDGLPVRSYVSRIILKVEDPYHSPETVENYVAVFQKDTTECIYQFKFHNDGREPTLNEFIEAFPDTLKKSITVRINSRGETLEAIAKEVTKYLKKKRKAPEILTLDLRAMQYLFPSNRHLRLDDLKKYLCVYDLRIKELPPQQIITAINPKDDPKNLDTQKAYREYWLKAKKIIKFVENGIFPGPYDKTSSNRLKKRKAKNS